MEYKKDIVDMMVDRPCLMLLFGMACLYLGIYKIFSKYIIYDKTQGIFKAFDYILIIGGIGYIIFSIIFTIINTSDKKHMNG